MSHFCVLVVTESKPTEDMIADVLAPYHEFECTGINDEYIQDIDKTDEIKVEYENYKNEGQSLVDYLLNEYNCKTVLLEASVDYEGDHKFGYAIVDLEGNVEKIVRRTNPNAKWDWWVIGGRFSEYLVAKPAVFNLTKNDMNFVPLVGEPGLLGAKSQNKGFDIIKKSDVDFDAMRSAAKKRGLALYDEVYSVVGTLDGFTPWRKVRDELFPGEVETARDFYHAQPARVAINEHNRKGGKLHFIDLEDFMCTRDEYAKKCEDSAIVTFAVLKDGEWTERGSMGWWGMVSDEKDKDDWNAAFSKMLDEIPDDFWLTIVDCHI